MRLSAFLKLSLMTLFVLVTAGPSIDAQETDLRYPHLERLFNPQPRAPAYRPSRPVSRPVVRHAEPTRAYVHRRREAREATVPGIEIVLPPPAILPGQEIPLPAGPETTIAVMGDTLGMQLAAGLREAYSASPNVTILNKAKGDTGLVNMSERDWGKFSRELVASAEKIDIVIMMIGSNDNQAMRDETGQYQEPLTEKWREIYARRIDEIIMPFKEKRIPFIWVGLPIMKYERMSARMLAMNDIVRERVQRAGQTYVDVWEGFSDEKSQFSVMGPDVSGQIVKMRALDGVHFTKAGGRKLAFFTEKEVNRAMDASPKAVATQASDAQPSSAQQPFTAGQTAMLPNDINEQIKRAANPGRREELAIGVPLPDQPLIPIIPQRPLSGPVISLTGPALARDGKLTTGEPVKVADKDAFAETNDVLRLGRSPRAKQGRADDFAWKGP
jgi:uncharacterized protein